MPEDNFISIGESLGDPTPETQEAVPETAPEAPKTFTSQFEADMKASNPEYNLPEGFDSMPEADRYNLIKENFSKPQSEDPFVSSYMKAKEQGYSSDDFINQQTLGKSVKNMGSREFLVNDLKRENGKSEANPNGWEDNDIISHVDGLNKVDLDIKANERKQSILNTLDAETAQHKEALRAQVKKQAETANAGPIVKTVDTLFSKMAKMKDIGGIPHNPDDQAKFKQMFTDAVSINPDTGYSRTRELFSNDEVLYKALYLYSKVAEGDSSLRTFLSGFKEEYKQDILDKTGLAPRKVEGAFQNIELPKSGDYV